MTTGPKVIFGNLLKEIKMYRSFSIFAFTSFYFASFQLNVWSIRLEIWLSRPIYVRIRVMWSPNEEMFTKWIGLQLSRRPFMIR